MFFHERVFLYILTLAWNVLISDSNQNLKFDLFESYPIGSIHSLFSTELGTKVHTSPEFALATGMAISWEVCPAEWKKTQLVI